MPLKPFSYPVPETRFFHAGNSIYKFKFRYGNSTTTANLPSNEEDILQDLEDAVRTVLGNLENLQPFVTKYFTVFPYKRKWERVSQLRFKHGTTCLVAYPYVCTLYVEVSSSQHNAPSGEKASFTHNPKQIKATQTLHHQGSANNVDDINMNIYASANDTWEEYLKQTKSNDTSIAQPVAGEGGLLKCFARVVSYFCPMTPGAVWTSLVSSASSIAFWMCSVLSGIAVISATFHFSCFLVDKSQLNITCYSNYRN